MNTERTSRSHLLASRGAPLSARSPEMPYGLETAVLAHWREAVGASLGERGTAAWPALGRVDGLCGRPAHRGLEKR